jgi:redox-sensitive bicupin YhaK (pirin superfamily)
VSAPTLVAGREVDVGGVPVRRLLPRVGRRSVGAWCFVDVAGPVDAAAPPMQVGPHPHMGLHTVTWMIDGEVVHRDSLGTEQLLRPGQLNLMTAGHGIAHAEQAAVRPRGGQHLVQLWIAQPEATRHGPPGFAHHAELPVVGIGASRATVLVGTLAGATSPVRVDTPLLGADLHLDGPVEVPLDPGAEHAVLTLTDPVVVQGRPVPPHTLAYLAPGANRLVAHGAGVRALLLGGEPFAERLVMHGNFVGRGHDELTAAVRDWNEDTGRFGTVGGGLPRIPAPAVTVAGAPGPGPGVRP